MTMRTIASDHHDIWIATAEYNRALLRVCPPADEATYRELAELADAVVNAMSAYRAATELVGE